MTVNLFLGSQILQILIFNSFLGGSLNEFCTILTILQFSWPFEYLILLLLAYRKSNLEYNVRLFTQVSMVIGNFTQIPKQT